MDRKEMLQIAMRQITRDARQIQAIHDYYYGSKETDRERMLRWINDPTIIKASKTEVI